MIIFHDGTHKDLDGYTGGRAWDNVQLLRAPTAGMNTEAEVKRLLAKCGDVKIFKVALKEFVAAPAEAGQNVWVIKGFHQRQSALGGYVVYSHLTISVNGVVYHLKFGKGNADKDWKFVACSASKKRQIKDLDGFSL